MSNVARRRDLVANQGTPPAKATSETTPATVEANSAWPYVLRLFIIHRVLISLVGVLATLFLPVLGDPPRIYIVPQEVYPASSGLAAYLLAPWQRWDTEHYLTIAVAGYSLHPASISFPPLYPFLAGGLGRILFGQYMLAALIVSNVAYLLMLYYFFRLTELRWGTVAAKNACLWLACFPTAFFFLMAYTESLFMVLVLAAFYYCEKEKWWLGAGLACLAGLTRLQGAILILPFAVFYWQKYLQANPKSAIANLKSKILSRQSSIALLLIPVGFLAYQVYINFFPPFKKCGAVSNLADYFNVKITWPGEALYRAITTPIELLSTSDAYLNLYNFTDLGLLILFIYVLWLGRTILPLHFQVYGWATLVVLLTRSGTFLPLVSMGRYLTTLFPVFMVVGVGIAQNRFRKLKYRRLTWLTLGGLFQLLLVVLFILWGWAG